MAPAHQDKKASATMKSPRLPLDGGGGPAASAGEE